jgi:ribonuclease P protein component
VTSGPCATPRTNSQPGAEAGSQTLPKARRLLKRAEFRQVYDQGFRVVNRTCVAFCWKVADGEPSDGPKVGFTTTRALGKAVKRNRMRRRLRETVRRRLSRFAPEWRIVWNLRGAALDASQEQLESDVERVIARCNG